MCFEQVDNIRSEFNCYLCISKVQSPEMSMQVPGLFLLYAMPQGYSLILSLLDLSFSPFVLTSNCTSCL